MKYSKNVMKIFLFTQFISDKMNFTVVVEELFIY